MLAARLDILIDEQALQDQDPEDRYITSGVSWQNYESLLDRPLDAVYAPVNP